MLTAERQMEASLNIQCVAKN